MASAARADLVVGQAAKFNLPAILQARGVMPAVAASSLRQEPVPRFNTTRALVKVQDGCSYFCSYCVVPYARGAPVSRRAHDVVQEVRGLVEAGFREFSLTGANLGLYEDGPRKLPDLLEAVTGVPGVLRVRLSSIEVSTVERAVIDYLCDSPKMCSYLHLPLQSGDDRVLAAMGRRYTTAQFRRAVEYAANRAPWLGLGTDLIVGFPGEDEKAFINTLALVRELPFSNLHVFTYSKREGTRAAQLRDSVARPEKKRRSAVLIAAGEHKRLAFAERLVGCEVAVLVERVTEEGCASGWTSEYVRAELAGAAVSINTIVMFHPTSFVDGILR